MSRKIRKGGKKPLVKKVFALVVDGHTESWYIQQLNQQLKKQEKGILVGLDLQPKLPQKKKLEALYEFIEKLEKDEYDKIFWIVDFDTIIKISKESKKGVQTELDKFIDYYKKLSINKKIVIIINNPCLEYWFLLHFVQTSKYFSSYDELKKELKNYIKDYSKTGDFYNNCNGGNGIYSFLKPKLKTAILNSKKLAKFIIKTKSIKDYNVGVSEMYKLFDELKIIS